MSSLYPIYIGYLGETHPALAVVGYRGGKDRLKGTWIPLTVSDVAEFRRAPPAERGPDAQFAQFKLSDVCVMCDGPPSTVAAA